MEKDALFGVAMEIQLYAALLLKFYNQSLEERLHQQGERMSSLQYGILRMLLLEPLTASTLSQRMGLDPSTLVRAVDALERKGLAKRGSDPRDRRRNPIAITEQGMALMATVPVLAETDSTFQALQSLGLATASQIRDGLRRFIQQFPEGKLVVALADRPGSQGGAAGPTDPEDLLPS